VSNGMRNEFASHTDFGFLRGLFDDKPNIIPSNLDMIYGINGQFLVAEWKREDEEILLGQRILLKSLAKQSNFTVLIINGYSDSTETYVDSFYQVASDRLIYIDKSVDQLKSYIKTWFDLAFKKDSKVSLNL
jgi:hypothetical protein